MRRWHLPDWAILIPCSCAMLAGLGCVGDGMTGVEGWVVESFSGRGSDIALQQEYIEPRENLVENAWVELWSGDGNRLLKRWETKNGFYGVVYVGPYESGMRYVVKAGAPGHLPLNKKVKLSVGGNWALIQLAPAMNRPPDGQD